jgi:dipeptidyl aminopeptidase/acylaminoacyl peptidase
VNADTRERLREFRAPDEMDAENRAWGVVRSAYLDRRATVVRRSRWRLAVAPALAVIVAALLLSPAGASVRRLINQALGEKHAAPALFSLPSPGRILVSGPGGTWTAANDGSTRRLGPWSQASWSPHGLYVAVASGHRLAAVDPRGTVRWALARPEVSDPTWYSPSGYRVAYLSGGNLRVIDGDGTGDRLLATAVAGVAPAWRPGQADGPYELAYVIARDRLVVRDADTGHILWSAAPGPRPRELMWSTDGRRLLVLSAHQARVYAANGAPVSTLILPAGESASDGALSPNGRQLALVLANKEVVVAGSAARSMRQVLAGPGVRAIDWSPDGRWLLVSWPAANQWVFVRVAGAPRVAAVSRIAQQFSSGGGAPHGFPQIEGWCCTAEGSAG